MCRTTKHPVTQVFALFYRGWPNYSRPLTTYSDYTIDAATLIESRGREIVHGHNIKVRALRPTIC